MVSENAPSTAAAPAQREPGRRKGLSYVEIKVCELIVNLCIATLLMMILMAMTIVIGLIRRH
jgi:hypothetical protein